MNNYPSPSLSLPPPKIMANPSTWTNHLGTLHGRVRSGALRVRLLTLTSQAAATSAASISPSLVAVPDFPPVTRRKRKKSPTTKTCPVSRARMTRSTLARRRRAPKRSPWDEFDPVHGVVIPGWLVKPICPPREEAGIGIVFSNGKRGIWNGARRV